VMCDSKGVIRADRDGLTEQKREFATSRDIHTLAEAMKGADVFLGLSVAGVVTPDMVRSMAPRPIVFALANPNPEIDYYAAKEAAPAQGAAPAKGDALLETKEAAEPTQAAKAPPKKKATDLKPVEDDGLPF